MKDSVADRDVGERSLVVTESATLQDLVNYFFRSVAEHDDADRRRVPEREIIRIVVYELTDERTGADFETA